MVVAEGYEPIMITPTNGNGGKGGSSNNDGGSNNNDGSSNSNDENTPKYNVNTDTTKKWTEDAKSSINYDPFSNIKIVNEEQKAEIQKARVEVKRQINDQREKIETKFAIKRAELQNKIAEAEENQKVTGVITITVVSAVVMAMIIFGMIKLVRHFSPDKGVIMNEKEIKENRDFSDNGDNKSNLDVQYDANKEMFTEMYDTEHKLKGNLAEAELNLEMANTINILQKEKNPNMVNLEMKDKQFKRSNSQIEPDSSSEKHHASGETNHKEDSNN